MLLVIRILDLLWAAFTQKMGGNREVLVNRQSSIVNRK
jgi:hypothetical protein